MNRGLIYRVDSSRWRKGARTKVLERDPRIFREVDAIEKLDFTRERETRAF